MRRLPGFACVFAVVLVAPASATAQSGADVPDGRYRPTRGLLLPDTGLAGDADATAIELNPGQLGFARDAPLAFGTGVWGRSAPLPGRGWGLYAALPFVGPSAVGFGLQQVLRTDTQDPGVSYPDRWKLSLGWGTRLGSRLGVGFSWAHVYGGGYRGVDTFDLGASLRVVNALALGVVVEDVNRPRLGDAPDRLPVRWLAEAVVRPWGRDVLELAAGAYRTGSFGATDLSPRFRLRGRLWSGLWGFAAAEFAHRDPAAMPPAGTYDRRFTVGLAIDLPHAGVSVAGHQGSLSGPGGDGAGFGLLARAYTDRAQPPLLAARYVARLELDGLNREREWVSFAARAVAVSKDPAVAAVMIQAHDDLPGGMARGEELRALIGLLRSRGKPVIMHLRDGGVTPLYVASAASLVVLHPAASVRWNGLANTLLFFEGTLDRLGIDAQVVRFGDFKGAYEPYTRRELSEPVRNNYMAMMDERFERIIQSVSDGRRQAGGVARLRALVDRGLFTPPEAVAAGLVDAVATEHETEKLIGTLLRRPGIAVRDADVSDARSPRWLRRKVAVVVLDGPIIEGASRRAPLIDSGSVGADTIIDALDSVRQRTDVAAVVLRVQSPGGSALASDRIAGAVRRVREAGKPVVVSFGDVAASGGYYVSAYADAIFAEPSTLTGSIGVIGLKVSAARLFNAVGVNTQTLKRGEKADLMGPHRPWTPDERDAVERSMRHTYERFVGTVAAGRSSRGLTPAKVDAVGQGRVWTGATAMRIGLVDQIGGVVDAIAHAATMARVALEPDGMPELVVLPRPSLSDLLRGLTGGAAEAIGFDPASVADLTTPTLPTELSRAATFLLPHLEHGDAILTALPFTATEW